MCENRHAAPPIAIHFAMAESDAHLIPKAPRPSNAFHLSRKAPAGSRSPDSTTEGSETRVRRDAIH